MTRTFRSLRTKLIHAGEPNPRIQGAVSMPICCFIMAHDAKFRPLFLIPVSSLLVGATLTLWEVIKL